MIQRIQSLYLLIAGLLPTTTLFIPVVLLQGQTEAEWITISSFMYDNAGMQDVVGLHPFGLLILCLATIILTFSTILRYKNRKKQMRMINAALLSNLMWYATLIAYTMSLADRLQTTNFHIEFSIVAPFIAIIFLYMAKRAIKKDEDLVRAADRIR